MYAAVDSANAAYDTLYEGEQCVNGAVLLACLFEVGEVILSFSRLTCGCRLRVVFD